MINLFFVFFFFFYLLSILSCCCMLSDLLAWRLFIHIIGVVMDGYIGILIIGDLIDDILFFIFSIIIKFIYTIYYQNKLLLLLLLFTIEYNIIAIHRNLNQ